MRIQFVLDTLVLTGGIRVVFEHSTRLRARGHEVRILVPRRRVPSLAAGLGPWKGFLYEQWSGTVTDGLRAYGLADVVTRFEPTALERVPDADVVLATAWGTADWVARMPDRAGRKFYLVQGYEVWHEELRDRVEATWRLPLRKIVIAHWLERLARERFAEEVWARIPNGVDTWRFRPASRPAGPPHGVAMIYDPAAHKGMDDGVNALWAIHAEVPGTRFVLFGRNRMRHRLPPGSCYVRDPRQADLPGVYGLADVFVNSSHLEGFPLVVLEAMACGCALVATAVGETPEMGRVGEEYLITPVGRPDLLALETIRLLREPPRLAAIAAAGLALARRYTWERATDELERALTREDERGSS